MGNNREQQMVSRLALPALIISAAFALVQQDVVIPEFPENTLVEGTMGDASNNPRECPKSHPFVYHKGSHCCKSNKDSSGKQLTYDSGHCQGHEYTPCPSGATDGQCRYNYGNGHSKLGVADITAQGFTHPGYLGHYPKNLDDGKGLNGKWDWDHCAHTEGDGDTYFRFDLGSSKEVHGISIANRVDCTGNCWKRGDDIKVAVGDSDKNLHRTKTCIADLDLKRMAGLQKYNCESPVFGRYVFIMRKGTMNLCEVEINGRDLQNSPEEEIRKLKREIQKLKERNSMLK